MASLLISRAPQCMLCIRRATGSIGEKHLFPAGQQVRGKKKARKVPNKVDAHLLKDIKGYGKKGHVISVTAGVMRNQWFPQQKAEYATAAKLEELGLKKEDILQPESLQMSEEPTSRETAEAKETVAEEPKRLRILEVIANLEIPKPIKAGDGTGAKPEENVEAEKATEKTAERVDQVANPGALTAEHLSDIMAQLLPSTLEFQRTPMAQAKSAPKLSPSIAGNAKTSILTAQTGPGRSQKTSIYSAVSIEDIATFIKTILANDNTGAKIDLSPEDITLMGSVVGKRRVKHLGIYEIEIRLKGAPEAVRRTIKVSAQG